MSTDIKQLVRNRASLKKKLTTIEKYISSIKNGSLIPEISDIKLRYENNINLIKDFETVQKLIEEKCKEDELDEQFEEREPFETRYYSSLSFLKDFIEKNDLNILPNTTVNTTAQDSLQNYLLPKIKLPVFNGDYEQWLEFKQKFVSTIDSNQYLNDGQKYNFLTAALDGYAKRSIAGCEESQDYARAWQMLCDKFDRKRFLVDIHIKSIFNLNPINKATFLQFRSMLDEISKHLVCLEGMKLSKESLWDMAIINIIYSKLDSITQNKWKEFYTSTNLPTLSQFLEFLKERQDILQSQEEPSSAIHKNSNSFTCKKGIQSRSQINLSLNQIMCNYCKKGHTIYNCQEFLKLPIDERWKKVKSLKLCSNCLRIGHSKETCSIGSCRKCRNRHNTLLHNDKQFSNESKGENISVSSHFTQSDSSQSDNAHTSQAFLVTNNIPNVSVLLSTVTFKVKDKNGKLQLCRALLDSGAQSNLVSQEFVDKLGLPLTPTSLSLIGINQCVSNLTNKINMTIFSNVSSYQFKLCCYVTPVIASTIPSDKINISSISIPPNICLSDPEFYICKDIDMIIGSALFWDLLLEGNIKLGKNAPTLQNTKLGWIVAGSTVITQDISLCNFSQIIDLDSQLKTFWELNEIDLSTDRTNDDVQCEELFDKHTIRDKNGQFIVKLPLKYSPNLLGDSKKIAVDRFLALEKKFRTNVSFYQLYKNFIHEYIVLGHMTKVKINNIEPNYYLPHHGIYKESSLTTKLRVVFDGSSSSNSGWSLNDLQYTGPKVQNNIFDLLLRFRFYKYVVSADVSKMYRQILMHEDHKPLQQIIWRDSPSDELSVYQLNTVTYGTTSAPYLAIRCINQLALDNKEKYPLACQTILSDFYVDDLLTGSNNLEELQARCKDISTILKSANFLLRKWVTNDIQVLKNIPSCHIPNEILSFGEEESCKTLGVQYLSKKDILTYKIASIQLNNDITKRQILSIIAQIYDPLGLLAPVIIISKIIIQKLWSLKLSWDENVPFDLFAQWTQFYSQLSKLNQLEVPRHLLANNHSLLDIHCFCDASQQAYATCVYFRSVDAYGNYQSRLMCSKSKVSPVKCLTIPRLELCAALLGAQLVEQIMKTMPLSVPFYYWTDSQIVLCWLKKDPNQLQQFVSNRVMRIQQLTNIGYWHYVNTKENPADVASRGILPENLLKCSLWWNGPAFLTGSIEDLLGTNHILDIAVPELKKTHTNLSNTIREPFNLFSKFSNLKTLKHVTSYCFRFANNAHKSINDRIYGPLTIQEVNHAYIQLLKLSQLESFSTEISLLKSKKSLPFKNKLTSLSPFIDKDDLLRVGGRLRLTSLDFNSKHPILLSANHILTRLIFQYKHKILLHPGPQLLLSSIRQFYWPLRGRNLARKTTKDCLTCFKFNPRFATYPMASLPENRIKPSLPFQCTGLDFAGPFPLKDKLGRGSKLLKGYVCVFVCFCTKAVHFELVSNLTTECFLSCLKRFTSRRGVPTDIFSDNGTTFVGAKNEMNDFGLFLTNNNHSVNNFAITHNIQWHFIPPYSPNFGGLWEAAVKSFKYHLKRALLDKKLIYEELNSLLIQIEGILNSRPLFAHSNDPNDLTPLTPSHFLIGRSIISIPEPDLTNTPTGRMSRLETIQQMYQQFWNRFKNEYLSQLHQQYKWKEQPTLLKVGTLVLVRKEQQPPCKWPLGRISNIYKGKDGVSRVAQVKTVNKTLVRSVRHLCPLPMETETV